MRGWHFTNGWKLRDGTPLEIGRTYTVDLPITMCVHGLHASVRAIDALEYAPGTVVSLVECGGEIIRGDDKFVCSERTVISAYDATVDLRLWAADCAEAAMMAYGNDDPRSWASIEAARAYALGEIPTGMLTAALDAAWAAGDAARAAGDAALAAAWAALAAARAAAGDAGDAARAAGAAARAAIWAEWDDMNATLEEYLHEGMGI